MTQPLEPSKGFEVPGNSEFSWGPGMFPPGIANNEGQKHWQDDFGRDYGALAADGETYSDNHARVVADRRTDPCDPTSNRDFTALGNCDRFGAAPPLVEADPEKNVSQYSTLPLNQTPRAR